MDRLKQFLNRCKREYDNLVYKVAVWWKVQDTEDKFVYIAGSIVLSVMLFAVIMSQ